jgi:hypothetical protein
MRKIAQIFVCFSESLNFTYAMFGPQYFEWETLTAFASKDFLFLGFDNNFKELGIHCKLKIIEFDAPCRKKLTKVLKFNIKGWKYCQKLFRLLLGKN